MTIRDYYPIFIDLSQFNVLIIGGGKIGTKRALTMKKYGANVTVLSLSFSQELQNSNISLIKGDASLIDTNFLQKFDLILTCTNNFELNKKICDLAKKIRKLCNNPTNIEDSNFIVPIFYSDKDLEIAITTRGKSSILAKEILSKVKDLINNDEMRNLLDAMYNVKLLLKEKIKDPSIRYILYHKIYDDEVFRSYASKGNLNKALNRVEEIINEYK